MLSINTNYSSLISQNFLSKNNFRLHELSGQIASGKRITSAKIDAAGLAVSMKMNANILGMGAAMRNVQDAQSYIKIAKNNTKTIGDILGRMKELATLATNGSLEDADRTLYNEEYAQLISELDDVVSKTKFNGVQMLGSDAGTRTFQVGSGASDTLNITTADLSTLNDSLVDLTTAANATTELGSIDTAINTLNSEVAKLGAYGSRLDFTYRGLETMKAAQEASFGRIVDLDMAKATAELSKLQILQQSNIAMLSMANQQPQMVLGLLR